MTPLFVLILAVAGVFLPADQDSFLVTQGRMSPLLFVRKDAGIWEAYSLKKSTGTKKFYGVFHINGLAIGRQTSTDFNYSDVTELLPIKSLQDLKSLEPLQTKKGGNIYIRSNKGEEAVVVNYSPSDLTKKGIEVRITWADKLLK